MEIINCIQGSPEWFAVKRGKISSSNISDILAKGQGKMRRAYMLQLAAERLTNETQDGFNSKYMERGKEFEQEAIEYYEKLNDCKIQQIGFVKLNEDEGSSPDSFVSDDGTLEIKCPLTTTHLETILNNEVPTCYIPQIQHQLYVSGRQWCDFMSFDPRVESKPAFIKRVYRDEKFIETMKVEIETFINDLNNLITSIKNTEF